MSFFSSLHSFGVSYLYLVLFSFVFVLFNIICVVIGGKDCLWLGKNRRNPPAAEKCS